MFPLPKVSTSESSDIVSGTLHGKCDFADLIKNLEMGRLPWILQVDLNVITNVLLRVRRRLAYREGNVIMNKIGVMCSEDEGSDHHLRDEGGNKNWETQSNGFSLQSF